jgi:hypothetical protein
MIRTINPCLLNLFLEPLTGLADDDAAVEAYRSLDPNDPAQVRQVIRRELVPHFAELADKGKERARLALSYYLSLPGINFEDVFEAGLPPFDPPDDPRLFFLWLWEEIFPGESYEFGDPREVKIVSDVYETNRYNRPRRPVSVRLDSLELSAHGRLFGEIWLNLGWSAFPEERWSDFVAIVLSWWLENTASLMNGLSSVQNLPFMGGLFSVELKSFDRQSANIRYLKGDDSVVSTNVIRLDRLLSDLVSNAEEVLTECRNRGWQSSDIRELGEALAKALGK